MAYLFRTAIADWETIRWEAARNPEEAPDMGQKTSSGDGRKGAYFKVKN